MVERCINALSEEKRSDIFSELIATLIELLIHDQVVNYIVQTAFRVSEVYGSVAFFVCVLRFWSGMMNA